MNMYILEGNLDRAKEIGNKILASMNAGCIDSVKITANQLGGATSELSATYSTSTGGGNSQQLDFFNEQCNVK